MLLVKGKRIHSALEGQIEVFADLHELSRVAAEKISALIDQSLRHGGPFAIALSGGRTPMELYGILSSRYRDRIPWDRVHLFWGDERYVPSEDSQSNYKTVQDSLLAKVPIPPSNVHPIPTDMSTPESAADSYEASLREYFGRASPSFDLTLLGLGSDGHTASLFPGSPALSERTRWVMPVRSPVPPPVRITLTLDAINSSKRIFFLVSGEGKGKIIRSIVRDPEGCSLPGALVKGELQTVWLLDRDAAHDFSP